MEKYEIREIDAMHDGEGWYYNTSYKCGVMTTGAKNVKRAFTAWLRREQGIVFLRGRTRIKFDGDVYEICDRKTGEPLFIAIPV